LDESIYEYLVERRTKNIKERIAMEFGKVTPLIMAKANRKR
jgi:hypothetical protein